VEVHPIENKPEEIVIKLDDLDFSANEEGK
jgi:hypothetical protein